MSASQEPHGRPPVPIHSRSPEVTRGSSMHDDPSGGAPMSPDKGPETAISILQKLADQEVTRSDRASSRARQGFALAAGFFAVVQTVAFNSFAKGFISTHERHVLLWMAGGAALALTACAITLLIADGLFKSKNITPDDVLGVLDSDDDDDGLTTQERFVEYLAGAVDGMRKTNGRRNVWVFITQLTAAISVLAVLAELVYSLDARLR